MPQLEPALQCLDNPDNTDATERPSGPAQELSGSCVHLLSHMVVGFMWGPQLPRLEIAFPPCQH